MRIARAPEMFWLRHCPQFNFPILSKLMCPRYALPKYEKRPSSYTMLCSTRTRLIIATAHWRTHVESMFIL